MQRSALAASTSSDGISVGISSFHEPKSSTFSKDSRAFWIPPLGTIPFYATVSFHCPGYAIAHLSY
jgi:hypothetical protein